MTPLRTEPIAPQQVHETLSRHLLADGYDIVLDLDKSRGRRIADARSGRTFLDMFSCFATMPLGYNHPKMKDPDFTAKLLRAAIANPSNSDVYTVEFAEFVDAFGRIAMPDYLPHLFVVAGGSLGVENALKAAFDWKVRQNFRKGATTERGHQVLHFKDAFHGRSGYTLSLTNTADPRKYEYFPKFDWPRIDSPYLRFPITPQELERVAAAEAATMSQIRQAFEQRGDDIACILLEPIQAEGGDHHFRPEFLRALRAAADEHDVLLVWDEVQTGFGITGKMWAHQHDDVRPDLLSFGKKTQVCGMMAGPRLDVEPDNVFRIKSRINSTWGGNLVDMVRCQRYLEILEEDRLVERARDTGAHLLQRLQTLAGERAGVLSNPRGKGLMCAIEFTNSETRDQVQRKAYELGMIILPCGTSSLRFRPPLDVTIDEVDEAIGIIKKALDSAPARG